MPRGARILRWLNIGVVLFYLIGGNFIAVAQQDPIQEAEALNQQVLDLYRQGRYEEAMPRAERALAINEKALGPDHPATALSLNRLAMLYHATGAYGQAEPLYQRALALSEKALGPDHPNTATSLNHLAALYAATGAYGQAEPLYQRTLAILFIRRISILPADSLHHDPGSGADVFPNSPSIVTFMQAASATSSGIFSSRRIFRVPSPYDR